MAMAISNIPVLRGEVADHFIRQARVAEKERGIVDFSRQRENMKKILARSKR